MLFLFLYSIVVQSYHLSQKQAVGLKVKRPKNWRCKSGLWKFAKPLLSLPPRVAPLHCRASSKLLAVRRLNQRIRPIYRKVLQKCSSFRIPQSHHLWPIAGSQFFGIRNKSIDTTGLEWPSKTCNATPVFESHRRTIWSWEAEASCWPSRENLTNPAASACPSRVCKTEIQSFSAQGSVLIQGWNWLKFWCLMTLWCGLNIRAEMYNCKGVSMIIDRFLSISLLASILNCLRQSAYLP